MPDFHGLELLAKKIAAEYEKTKKMLEFSTGWIDCKHREGGRITAKDHQEFLDGLSRLRQ